MKATQPLPDTLPNFIASNLRVLRKSQGWSQAELAEKISLNRGNIASYESGNAEPNICKTLRVSKLFGINPRDLIRRDLSDPQELVLSQIAYSQDQEVEQAKVSTYQAEARHFADLIQSSRRLFDHKRAQASNACTQSDQIAAHYEQLSDVARQLLERHQDLLADFGCQCD